jgi:peroxiredoxin
MSDITPIIPRQPLPDLNVPVVGGGTWSVGAAKGDPFTMVVVYRGLHCPICKMYLKELQRQLPEFDKRGVEVFVLSSDDAERAERAKAEWGLTDLAVGHSLDLATARRWGLYVSTSNGVTSAGVEEPEMFAEPGIFMVRPDGTLYFATTQTMPFARPRFEDIVKALDIVIEKNYPARGEVELVTAAKAAAE